jgi:glc operon protein GlcG
MASPVRGDAPPLSLAQAQRVVAAAEAEAHRLGAPGAAVAVVDLTGFPVAVARLDGTFAAAGAVSVGKARTAAIFGRPTKAMEEAINKGRTAMTVLAAAVDAVPLQGGVPLMLQGRVVGAVGVSGAASADQDTAIAEAAAPAVADPASLAPVALAHLEAAEVEAGFAVGKPLLENAAFKVHASRRDRAGEAEIHTLDTDILYVVSGEATLVLGGTVLEPRNLSPTEIRGRGIEGGESHALRAGDVLVIPAGTPHWFRELGRAPVLYYAVKSTGGLQ